MIFINSVNNFYDKPKPRMRLPYLILILVIFISFATMLSFRKTVTLVIDNKSEKFSTYSSTVGDALKKKNIKLYAKDKLDKNLNDKLSRNSVINIKRAINVHISVDNRELNLKSAEDNVSSLLKSEGILLSKSDKISPSLNSSLKEGMKINITRVEEKLDVKSATVPFNTIVKKDNSILKSKEKVLQEGKNGEKQVTTSLIYENGKVVSKKVIKEIVTKKPVNKIIAKGTLTPPHPAVASRGNSVSNGTVMRVKATAYWAVNGVGSTYTSSGRKAIRNPNGYSTIAVDPRVIPFGTKLYVEGYGYAIAADEGTSIIGKTIDVYFNTYKEACNWGLKYINVHILS